MPESDHRTDSSASTHSDRQHEESTPADVFDLGDKTVDVSIARPESESADDTTPTGQPMQRTDLTHPGQAIPLGDGMSVVGSTFNETKDKWEVLIAP